MSTTRGVRALVGAALASSVILLGGCSSSGTTPAGSSNPLTGGLTGHTSAAGSTGGTSSTGGSSTGGASSSDTSDTTGGDSSSDDSSSTGGTTGALGGSDPGCQAAVSDLQTGTQALTNAMTNPAAAIAGIKAIGDKMHTDAGKSTNPAAAAAINKVGDDYITFANGLGPGKVPDTSALQTDATAMATACVG